ncbi:hypothetical protein HBI70_209870 [Parastagonospora nodorum]|nr:hypothetical protein HBH50_091010 [Parastagonospora nodorum]KAH4413712.1 hypothetical protein HBH92_096970 [Parastagonospora nodorum]KAH4417331.1 hypothetical protein HBH93_209460 [Parastagonospora nodorum]KAH4532662.1 hypothetical protein HBH86_207600 [Parastagonospora nodorum]KAH4543668.1 hypothetical protein HBH85_106620 [Parastagonospora nodorum]
MQADNLGAWGRPEVSTIRCCKSWLRDKARSVQLQHASRPSQDLWTTTIHLYHAVQQEPALRNKMRSVNLPASKRSILQLGDDRASHHMQLRSKHDNMATEPYLPICHRWIIPLLEGVDKDAHHPVRVPA